MGTSRKLKSMSSKRPSHISLSPKELKFELTSPRAATRALKLTNTHAAEIGFKIKTTAPKRYCVRPNSGVIAEGGSVEIQVTLQPEKGKSDENAIDKFLVQTLAITSDMNTSDVSKLIQKNKGKLGEKKLKSYYTLSVDSGAGGRSTKSSRGGGPDGGGAPEGAERVQGTADQAQCRAQKVQDRAREDPLLGRVGPQEQVPPQVHRRSILGLLSSSA